MLNDTLFQQFIFRFGHSMIQPFMKLLSEQELVSNAHSRTEARKFYLRHHFNNPDMFKQDVGLVEDLMRGLISQPIGKVDKSFTREITNHLFEEKKRKFSGAQLTIFLIF